MNKPSIYAIIVTYGEREYFLISSIKALLKQSVKINKIIVVNNGSNLNSSELVYKLDCVDILNFKHNLGSALAYKKGIELACNENAELLWLIDDDNIADEFALENLLNFDKQKLLDSEIVLSSFRTSRKKYNDLFYTYQNGLLVKKKTLFFDFLIFKKKKVRRFPIDWINVDYVTYGGLLLSSKCVKIAGFPDHNYFLYMDDREYTYRISNFGIKIYVIRTSKIEDIDNSWASNKYIKLPVYFIPDTSRTKTFYSFRNKIRFDLKYSVSSKNVYKYSIKFYIIFGCLMGLINRVSIKNIISRAKLLYSIMNREFKDQLNTKNT